jgi:hypothetical protein
MLPAGESWEGHGTSPDRKRNQVGSDGDSSDYSSQQRAVEESRTESRDLTDGLDLGREGKRLQETPGL